MSSKRPTVSARQVRGGDWLRWPVPAMALALLALGFAAYANSFSAPFVFDDHGSIVENAHIRRLWPLASSLSGPVQSAVAGRPVVSLSLALNYVASNGLSAGGFRAGNLAIHLLTGLLLFGVARRTFAAPSLAGRFGDNANQIAWVCALVWLVHPLNSEVVDYVIQRTESLMGLFYLLTLYATVRSISAAPANAWRWNAVATAACALGMASKESMVTAPVMVLVYDAVFWAGGIRRALRARWPLHACLAATWLLLVSLIISGPRSHSAGFSSGVTPWTYLLNQPAMIVRYLTLAFWPHGLVLDYGLPRTVMVNDALPYALVIVALLAATCVAWRRHAGLAFLGTWFFVTLAPSSSLVPIATEVGAERRMYLPLMAVIVVCVLAARMLLARLPISRRSSVARRRPSRWGVNRRGVVEGVCLAALYTMLMVLTLQRNAEYRSRTGIWQTVLDRRPHGRAHYNLAIESKELGHRGAAIEHYQLALTDQPDAHYAVGFELDADGRRTEAIAHYREFIRLRPDDATVVKAYILLGRALVREGQLELGEDAFRQAIARHAVDIDAWAGLADVLLTRKRIDEAIRAYREYARLDPGSATAYSGLGVALVERNLEQEAVPAFTRAVELDPNDAGKRNNLGLALASTGRLDEAVIQFRRGLALAPRDVRLHNALGLVLAAQGHADEALSEFRQAMAIDPANEETRRAFATAFPRLSSAGRTP